MVSHFYKVRFFWGRTVQNPSPKTASSLARSSSLLSKSSKIAPTQRKATHIGQAKQLSSFFKRSTTEGKNVPHVRTAWCFLKCLISRFGPPFPQNISPDLHLVAMFCFWLRHVGRNGLLHIGWHNELPLVGKRPFNLRFLRVFSTRT